MIGIDRYAYRSRLSRIDPKAKLAFSLIPLVLCIGFESFGVSVVTLVVMSFVTIRAGLKPHVYFKLMLVPISFLVIAVVTVIVNDHAVDDILLVGIPFGSGKLGIDWASLIHGCRIFIKSFSAVSCAYFLSLNTPMNDLLNTLRQCKLPKIFVELMELIYRFIFVMTATAVKMHTAQASRLGYISFKRSMHSMGEMVAMIFVKSYIRSDRIYNALASRGYDGDLSTMALSYTSGTKVYILCAILSISLIAVGMAERLWFS